MSLHFASARWHAAISVWVLGAGKAGVIQKNPSVQTSVSLSYHAYNYILTAHYLAGLIGIGYGMYRATCPLGGLININVS
jgi:hypothetical protein